MITGESGVLEKRAVTLRLGTAKTAADYENVAFLFALSVAVGLTPELLPMVVNACLAKGCAAMGKKQTVVKTINAMQGFGSMDLLCVDKTGTLTGDVVALEYYMDVLGNESGRVLELAYLNSLYHTGVQNHLDDAILRCREMPGQRERFESLARRCPKLDELPFDYERRLAGVLVGGKENLLIVKGSLDEVCRRCSHVEYKGRRLPMGPDAAASVHAVARLRELHVGVRVLPGDQKSVAVSICKRLAMITTTCTVTRREQELAEIPLDELVVGDIVHLSAGDMIPADLRILEAKDLFLSQASLTGESEPVEKTAAVSEPKETITDHTNIAFMVRSVVSGSATAVAVCVGDNTLFGSMAIAVGLTPEMLPMIVTTCLAKGAVSMSKKKTIFKNLNSIQNFGAIDVLCTDKTGTLTQDQVVLEYHRNLNGEEDTRVLRHAYLNSYFRTGYKNLMDLAIIRKTEEQEAPTPGCWTCPSVM